MLVGEIHEDGAGFEKASARFAVEDGGNLLVGRQAGKLGRELLALLDVYRMNFIRRGKLLEHDGNLAPIGRAPGIEIDHESVRPPASSICRSSLRIRS